MAQYLTDFSEYTTGVAPSDWTVQFGDFTANSIVEDQTALGGKVYRLTTTATSARRVVTWDDIPSVADCEVLMLFRSGAVNDAGSIVRHSGTTTSTVSTIRAAIINTFSELQIGRYDSGSFGQIAVQSISIDSGGSYFVRQKADGQNHYAKIWDVNSKEPTAWTVTGTSSTVTTAGNTGLFLFNADATLDVDWFSVGTGTDPAPMPSRKITVTDLKAPNDANSAIADATGVQVKLWVSSDSNDPTDTGAPDVLVTDATITGGTMEVTFDSGADVGNAVLGVAKWDVSTDTLFAPIETTVEATT